MGLLPDRSVVRVTGDDTPKLLDDTLTGRFQGPMGLEGRWFALLSPQGKIQVEGIATEADAAIWLDIPKSAAEAFLKRMKLYRLRAKVDFEDVSADTAVWWTAGNEGPKTRWAISYSDNRNALVGPGKERALGRRWLVPRPEIDVGSDASGAFAAARIAAGIAELGADFAPDTLFPHDIGMDLLGGVDFKKGCYIGQEVVSRMQHRGTARRRPVIVEGTTAPSGTPILVAGRDSGQVGRAVDGRAIGIVRLDRFDGGEVTVDGKPVTITLPDWATYRLGESAVAD